MNRPSSPRSPLIPIALCLGLIGLSLASAYSTERTTRNEPEYPFGCDSYGYLRMARQIRQTDGLHWTADFHFQYEQTRELTEALRTSGIPGERWQEIVAPHAHHYFPDANAVGPQYPPGTGVALSPFAEGHALRGINRFVIAAFTGLGIGLIIWTCRKGALLSGCGVTLALLHGLTVLSEISVASFSINAVVLPVAGAVVCAHLSTWCESSGRPRCALAFVSGTVLGLGMLIRIPVIFLVPGFCLLLLPRNWREVRVLLWLREPVVLFLFGLFCFGIVQLLWHQHRVAGVWYRSTYGGGDTGLPSTAYIADNFIYYGGRGGYGAVGHAVLIALVVVLITAIVGRRVPPPGTVSLRNRRLLAAGAVTWAVPTLYFLTHRVTTDYYLIPSTFATVWMMAMGIFAIERETPFIPYPFVVRVVIVGALGLCVFLSVRLASTVPSSPPPTFLPPSIPQEFQRGRPWIWADATSGTIEYYGRVPTFKLIFGDASTRRFLYAHAFATGSPQYFVDDCDSTTELSREIQALGATLEFRGMVAGFPYYLVHWPANGPPAVHEPSPIPSKD